MRRILFALSMLLLTSCRPDYTIELKGVSIRHHAGRDDTADIFVDKKSARLMSKYGEVHLLAKDCADESCRERTIGLGNRDEIFDAGDSARMEVELFKHIYSEDFREIVVRPSKCFKIEAAQGYVGRNGQSGWHCPAIIAN